ncbi:hypothetical protein [Streptomyces sp. NPDC058307]|uniref:hypothetical protein n=1 Tax=Streptomyces sp. NPDC058307 TaxID=3346439 RepID=UPI0036EBE87E
MTAETTTPDLASWPPLDDRERPAARRLLAWAADGSGTEPRLCLVRGAEGSGKSRLLAWFLVGSADHPATTVHATVLAEGLTAESFAWAMGRQLGYGPLGPARLLDRVSRDERPVLLLVPDLHRAGAGSADLPAAAPETLVAEVLEPLLSLSHVRAAVEVGDRELLSADGAEVIDLGEGTVDTPGGEAPYPELLAAVPHTSGGRPDWSRAPDPVRRYILDVALRADDQGAAVRELLTDPGFLVHGSAAALTALLADERVPVPGRLREVWRRAAAELTAYHTGSAERAALLHTAAVDTDPALAGYLQPLAERHWWTAVWARHELAVSALALVPGEERRVLATDAMGRPRSYEVDGGAPAGAVVGAVRGDAGFPPSFVRPDSVAPRDAHSVLLLDRSGALLPLVPEDEPTVAFVLGHIAGHHGAAALAGEESEVSALGNGGSQGPYAVVGDQGGTVHLWSLREYQDTPRACQVHEHPVTAATCVDTAEGLTLTFSAGSDGSVRLWEASSAEPMPVPVQQRRHLVTALAAADTPAGPVLAVAWSDGELHLWHVLSGTVRVLPLLRPCTALALTPGGLLLVGDPEGLYAVQLRPDALRELRAAGSGSAAS